MKEHKTEIARYHNLQVKVEQEPGQGIINHCIPCMSGIFDPHNFRFAAIEGYEEYLLPLFESVCALTKTHFALLYLDTDSPVIKTINKLGHHGLLSRIIKRVEADIIIKFINFSDKEKESFRNNPAYISYFDVI